jgi:hypothetical protein
VSDHDPTPEDLRDDERLLVALGHALDAHEPVPEDAVATAVAAFDLGRADTELAELVFDSLVDEPLVAMRHEGSEARSLGFVAHGYRVEVELIEEEAVLLGQLEPARAAEVSLETAGGLRHGEVDDLGRFRFEAARGSLRLRLTIGEGEGHVVLTPWITW